MQAPHYAQPGQEAVEIEVILELKTLADAGLIGLPNAGKSTLLSRLSNADPKIGNYPFTTLNPILGVVDVPDSTSFVMADIPGLVEGASEGVGLGHDFLRHIERTGILIHMVDAAPIDGTDPISAIKTINNELASFSEKLSNKPQIIVANKIDVSEDNSKELLERIKTEFPDTPAYAISAVTGQGVNELLYIIAGEVEKHRADPVVFESEYDPMSEVLPEDSITVEKASDGLFVVYGPKIEKMLGYTNLESEKGFSFFQKYFKEQGIEQQLKDIGIQDGDTVQIYELAFTYYS